MNQSNDYKKEANDLIAYFKNLVRSGGNINDTNSDGESLLSEFIYDCSYEGSEKPFRYDVVKCMLELGADPCILDNERGGPLVMVTFGMDTKMLEILLKAGADPNKEYFELNENLYEWAEFDYRFHLYDMNNLPEEPTEEEKENEDLWLLYLDRLAKKYNKRRPDHLFLLRKYGARAKWELEAEKKE